MAEPEKNAIAVLKTESAQLEAIMSLFNKDNIKVKVAQEIAFLEAAAQRQPDIKDCEAISVLLAVKSILKKNLTLDQQANLTYIKTRNVNVAPKGQQQPIWKKALEIDLTANGSISYNRMCGRILDIKRPEVEKDSSKQVIKVTVELLLPSTPAPRWEKFVFDEDDIYRWKRASHKDNSRGYWNLTEDKRAGKKVPNDTEMNYANELYSNFYGGIDPEFARAKAIKHALKKLGTNQNETKPGQLIITTIIDPEKDRKATDDENTFTPYTDVTNSGTGKEDEIKL